MTTHTLKTDREPFEATLRDRKRFEWRLEDAQRFELGDELLLLEVDQLRRYTGRELSTLVSYVLRGVYGVPEGFVVLGIDYPHSILERFDRVPSTKRRKR